MSLWVSVQGVHLKVGLSFPFFDPRVTVEYTRVCCVDERKNENRTVSII